MKVKIFKIKDDYISDGESVINKWLKENDIHIIHLHQTQSGSLVNGMLTIITIWYE